MVCSMLLQQRTYRPGRFLYLPNSITPMMDAIERIQSADPGKQSKFLALQQWRTQREIFCGAKRASLPAGFGYRFRHFLS